MAYEDMCIGSKFGKLVITSDLGMVRTSAGSTSRKFLCECECGTTHKEVQAVHLKSGRVQSCGCGRGKNQAGLSHTPAYKAWQHMLARCYNAKDNSYSNYGARGIAVCEEWRIDFMKFYMDMGQSPSSSHSLDRIDNNKNYEPGNCRWSTKIEQSKNRRTNVFLELNGESHCISEWAALTGINHSTIETRVKRGMSTKDALYSTYTIALAAKSQPGGERKQLTPKFKLPLELIVNVNRTEPE